MAENTETESAQEISHFDRTSDNALESLEQDLLDRAPFAKNLAKMIARRKGKSSFVFSLQGPWGSGKSSIKNMALDAIKEMPENERPIVIHFNPWQFRGSDALLTLFFAQINEGLGKESSNAASSMKDYAAKLALLTKVTKTVELPLSLFVGGAAGAVSKPLEALQAVFGEAEKNLASDDVSQNTLDTLRKELTEELKKLEVPVLIVIDDIDRLFAEETALIFQLVKANADFPNFIYLLLFDRDIVSQNLNKVVAGGGNNYLGKIVQHPIDVPMPNQGQVCELWLRELKRIYISLDLLTPENSRMWGELSNAFYLGLNYYLKNMRDVWRSVNALEASLPLVVNKRYLDVNFVDFAVLEVFRIFENSLYEKLYMHKNSLLGMSNYWEKSLEYKRQSSRMYDVHFSQLENGNNIITSKDELDSLLNSVTKGNTRHNESLLALLKGLFPKAKWDYSSRSIGFDLFTSINKSDKALSICDDGKFERYFQLQLTESEFKEEEIAFLITNDDIDVIAVRLLKHHQTERLLEFINSAIQLIENRDYACTDAFIAAVLRIGELPIYCREIRGDFFHPLQVVKPHLIRKKKTMVERAALLKNIFYMSQSLIYPINLLNGGPAVMYEGHYREGNMNEFNECYQPVINKINNLVEEDRLHQHPANDQILIFWFKQDPDAAKEWVQRVGAEPEKMFRILFAWEEHWNRPAYRHFGIKEMLEFFSLDIIQQNIEILEREVEQKYDDDKRYIAKIYREHFLSAPEDEQNESSQSP